MAEIIREIEFAQESSTHEKGSRPCQSRGNSGKKGSGYEQRYRSVARHISTEMTKINRTMFHTKNLKRENPYYSTLLNVVKIQWENFSARPPWNGVNFPASF